MSKMIKITKEYLDECTKEFQKSLLEGKFSDGKVSYTKTLEVDKKATVYFTEIAWIKMQCLVRDFDKEVAWHGVVMRGGQPNEYVISDILVYPQEVTGATVTTDQEKYQMWLMSHEDEVFNNIRMQGHSHVNMSTNPSGVDISLYEQILDQLDDDMFYIFMIWNKRGEKTIKIYDMLENVLFNTSDIKLDIIEDELGVVHFINEAKEMVVDKPKTFSSYLGGSNVKTEKSEPKKMASNTGSCIKSESNKDEKKRKNKYFKKVSKGSQEKQLSIYDDDTKYYGNPFEYNDFYDPYFR